MNLAFIPVPEEPVLSVADLTRRVKAILGGSPHLQNLLVRGEVSNFRDHPSGHLYFTLKDQSSSVRCIMFRSRRQAVVGGLPGNGEMATVAGRIDVYERDGQYQLYVDRLWRDEQFRLGELYRQVEELKKRLAAEGLFDDARKSPLPGLPRRVGIVTSPTAAVLRDIVRISRRRYPNIHLILIPAQVQGERAPGEIARAIDMANLHTGIDVLIVGRGGGSLEELWAFNSEEVARAISRSRIPVISAVGHETDFTVADLVADIRAPTPSGAAELAVPERFVLEEQIGVLTHRLSVGLRQQVKRERSRLERLNSRPVLAQPLTMLDQRNQRLDGLSHRLTLAARNDMRRNRAALERLMGRIEALDPTAVLRRGYGIVLDKDGLAITVARESQPGDRVSVVLQDGSLDCRVEDVRVGPKKKTGI